MVTLNIKRQEDDKIWYDTFHVEEKPGMNVLEALFEIQEKLDGSLCFRFACRGAVCGSCAMLINKVPRLACKKLVGDVKKEDISSLKSDQILTSPQSSKESNDRVLIEPLPNLGVIRDLVVDMEHFYSLVDSVQPWITAEENYDKKHLIEPATQKKLEKYTNCILCAVCHGICPAATRDDKYLSPAGLARAWRFQLDPRELEKSKLQRYNIVDSPSGVWGCDLVYKCVAVCPKKVPPTKAIKQMRRQISEK
ncbi:succinate dehydrogenase/fumarate reductase iron-sulfur subunit [Methanohalobium sp.]|uniref:succinate dehydrogenase/fumarate reductase iron-sulfur subunit n=1 Tax=Methanohalobium sp. TaxID=2837493 RepID=UPI0025E09624|nr:succinate dehydrogenase/fumarate reductase iron-sulfur subunit [Methanohalobium sp.]